MRHSIPRSRNPRKGTSDKGKKRQATTDHHPFPWLEIQSREDGIMVINHEKDVAVRYHRRQGDHQDDS